MELERTESDGIPNAPLGVQAIQKCCPCSKITQSKRDFGYRSLVLSLTFLAYMSLHAARRPLSVVKNVLNDGDCPDIATSNRTNLTKVETCTSWAPFGGSNANELLGYLDSCFLFAYAFFMFVSGSIAERLNLRIFLSIGMILTGIFTIMFGLAKIYDIHSFEYFAAAQVFAGIFQSTGFPTVVACMGNWFGKSRRGFIFGIWNAHVYIGNILGAYLAGLFVEDNWAYSFIVPGILVGGIGIIMFLILVPYPEDVHCSVPDHEQPMNTSNNSLESSVTVYSNFSVANNAKSNSEMTNIQLNPSIPIVKPRNESMPLMKSSPSAVSLGEAKSAITFIGALKIPGVIEFATCLFFSKLVCYTFMFWLPMYIDFKTQSGSKDSAYLSVPFDVGGIFGGILAGIISDRTSSSAITSTGFLILSIPMLFIYDAYGSIDTITNIALQVLCGALVNGPYALITTAVSAELGTHKTIRENSKALATVTAIIDGTGSIGGAVGPLLAGVVSATGWHNVFYMMMLSTAFAVLALMRVAYREGRRICRRKGYCCYS